MKNRLKLFIGVWFVLNALGCQPAPPSNQAKKAANKAERTFHKIYTVIDGDTFWLKDELGQIVKVRLIGIDAPEVHKSEHKDIQPFGQESKDFVRKFLRGKKVALEYDVEKYDQYGRTLAYVFLEDGTFLNDYIVRNGYARILTFPPNVRYYLQLLKSERYARQNKLGMWSVELSK